MSSDKPSLRLRPEVFGATVSIDEPPAIVFVTRAGARDLGAAESELWQGDETDRSLVGPVEVHLSVTSRCGVGCDGCYVDAKPDGHAPSLDVLKQRLAGLAELGAFRVAIGGGEPLTRSDLREILEHAKQLDLEASVTTSGVGLTEAKAQALSLAAQVNVSWDGPGELYEAVRGVPRRRAAEDAIEMLLAHGVNVGLNTVLTKQTAEHLEEIAEGAAKLGATELQLLRYKPSGRATLGYLNRRMTLAQRERLPSQLRAIAHSQLARDQSKLGPQAQWEESASLRVRIDCSLVPFLVSEEELAPELLERFGVIGCEGGRFLMTVTNEGAIAPCSFASAGQALEPQSYGRDSSLARFRAHHAALPAPCDTCAYRSVCRGGCRVVAKHLGDESGPDPECPRVLRFR